MGNIENSYLLHANFCKNPRPKLRGQYPVCRTHLCDCDMETQEQCVLAWRTCFGCTAKGVTGKNSRDACSLHRHDETQKLLECKYITMPSSAGPSATDGDEARLCGGRQPTQPPEQCKKHCSVIQQHCLIIFFRDTALARHPFQKRTMRGSAAAAYVVAVKKVRFQLFYKQS